MNVITPYWISSLSLILCTLMQILVGKYVPFTYTIAIPICLLSALVFAARQVQYSLTLKKATSVLIILLGILIIVEAALALSI